ncbi:MAG TPA: hypothetical protein VIC28_14435 [Thermoanaerobaculia bacterium]
MDRHPDLSLLASFGRGRLSRLQSRQIVRHLLARCGSCCRTLAARALPPLRPGENRGATPGDYGAAFAKVWRQTALRQAALAAERAAAPELLRELLAQPADRRELLAATSPRCHTWAFCELLLDAAGEPDLQDPPQALALARLGVDVAGRLAPAVYGEERVNDLQARAWAVLANVRRILGDFQRAEEGFANAERRLKKGTGDPLEKAQILLLKSSLRGNQQRFREAFRLLDRALAIGCKLADEQLCGKALLMKGFLRREAIAALLVFHQAAQMESVTLNLIHDVSRAARGLRRRESR